MSVFLNDGRLKKKLSHAQIAIPYGTTNDNAANVGHTKYSISRKTKITLQIVPQANKYVKK